MLGIFEGVFDTKYSIVVENFQKFHMSEAFFLRNYPITWRTRRLHRICWMFLYVPGVSIIVEIDYNFWEFLEKFIRKFKIPGISTFTEIPGVSTRNFSILFMYTRRLHYLIDQFKFSEFSEKLQQKKFLYSYQAPPSGMFLNFRQIPGASIKQYSTKIKGSVRKCRNLLKYQASPFY